MNGYQANGAGSPHTFLDSTDLTMDDFNMVQSTYFDGQHQQIMQTQPSSFGHSTVEQLNQSSSYWATNNATHQRPFIHPHWSSSTRSSGFSNPRSSDNSIFSQFQNRASTVSTDSALSNVSNLSRTQYLSQAEFSLTGQSSPHSSHASSPVEGPSLQPPRRRAPPRTSAPDKDYYKTCATRKQRARRSNTVQKYFCTMCSEAFVEKADWKRHEETYQERPEEFQCDLCNAKYFLDKDFVTHHVKRHECIPCHMNTKGHEKKHVQEARRPRKTRTGWGCGFCYHFSNDWTERCNHIAKHFDQEDKIMANWNHSAVIYSLLQRPAILVEWDAILSVRKRRFIGFGWDAQTTARVDGYPDSNNTLQLQDALEYYTPDQDAVALAQYAFNLAVKKVARERTPPPVPPKDNSHKPSLGDIMKETESMTQFINNIIDDERSPTGVTFLEDGALDDAFDSWFNMAH